MLFNSLIILLLSNSITSRRNKSIFCSITAITIVIITAFIAYDNFVCSEDDSDSEYDPFLDFYHEMEYNTESGQESIFVGVQFCDLVL